MSPKRVDVRVLVEPDFMTVSICRTENMRSHAYILNRVAALHRPSCATVTASASSSGDGRGGRKEGNSKEKSDEKSVEAGEHGDY